MKLRQCDFPIPRHLLWDIANNKWYEKIAFIDSDGVIETPETLAGFTDKKEHYGYNLIVIPGLNIENHNGYEIYASDYVTDLAEENIFKFQFSKKECRWVLLRAEFYEDEVLWKSDKELSSFWNEWTRTFALKIIGNQFSHDANDLKNKNLWERLR